MAHNLNVSGIVIQFLHEANMENWRKCLLILMAS